MPKRLLHDKWPPARICPPTRAPHYFMQNHAMGTTTQRCSTSSHPTVLPSSSPPISAPIQSPPWSPLQEAASSLELLPQSLAIMGQHPTATNAQSSQIISFNVNTKPARSHRRQPPLQFLLLQVNALRDTIGKCNKLLTFLYKWTYVV